MTKYIKRIYKNFKDFLSDDPNNTDRVLIKRELTPLVFELQRNSFDSPLNFVNIMKRFNFSRLTIIEFMKKIININHADSQISKRLLYHANSFEKNIVMTHQALKYPQVILAHLKYFTSEKYSYFKNQENIFSEFEKEIMKIHKNIAIAPVQNNEPFEEKNSQFFFNKLFDESTSDNDFYDDNYDNYF